MTTRRVFHGDSRREVKITDGQFRMIWDAYPHDEELIAVACREAVYDINVPLKTGRTQSGLQVYVDDGVNGSGYTLVHWRGAKRVPWCLDNGFPPQGFPADELPLVWDEQPERERALAIKREIRRWAYGS